MLMFKKNVFSFFSLFINLIHMILITENTVNINVKVKLNY